MSIQPSNQILREVNRKAALSVPALVTLVCGLAVSALGFVFIGNLVQQDERSKFRIIADRQVSAIQRRLERNIETVHSAGGLFDASEIVSRAEFSIFANQMISRVEGVQALYWNPIVTPERLIDIKRLARREGMPDFEFYERDEAGNRRPLGNRDDYIVVLYGEPVAGNRAAFGYDVGSDRARRTALDNARDTGEMVATAPIKLVQETGNQTGFLVFRPVYINGVDPKSVERRRQSIKGFTVGVYRIGDILAAALQNDASALSHIEMYDETDSTKPRILLYASARSNATTASPSGDVEADMQGVVVNAGLNIAGRVWTVIVRPSVSQVTPVERFSPWVFLAAGIVMSILVYGLLASARVRNSVIALEVESRTRELAQEVVERKAAELALQLSERTYAKLTEMAPIGIFIYRNRKLENANIAAANLLGASSVEELLGRERSEFLDPEYLDEADTRWELIRRGKAVPLWEVAARRLDGSTFPALIRTESVDIDGELYVITVVEDVSVETSAREALEESEEKYRSLIEFFPQGVLLTENGTITQINSTGLGLYGATQESEIVGRDWIAFVDPSFHETMMARRDSMAAGSSVEPIETLMKRVDGATFWGLAQAMPVNVSGKTLYMTVFDDITTRKEAEKEIENANRELVRSNEELARFAYVASHDLKEPLRMVSSYCDLIADRYSDALDETGQKFIHYATDGARRMQVLIDDLLLYSRIGRGGEEAEKIDLNDVVGDAGQMLAEAFRVSGATLSVADLPVVSAYRGDLTRLFQNLIGNAIKFRTDAALNIEIKSDRAGDSSVITVSDNGIGIAPEFRERVFGIFQRLHKREKYEGTGI